jgi:hypothetical protein
VQGRCFRQLASLPPEKRLKVKLANASVVQGTLLEAVADTIYVQMDDRPVPLALREIREVTYSSRSIEPRLMIAGAFVGMVAGGLIGAALAEDAEESGECSDFCGMTLGATIPIGGAVGFSAGLLLPLLIPHQDTIECR